MVYCLGVSPSLFMLTRARGTPHVLYTSYNTTQYAEAPTAGCKAGRMHGVRFPYLNSLNMVERHTLWNLDSHQLPNILLVSSVTKHDTCYTETIVFYDKCFILGHTACM